jgi:hypothetical protein
LLQQKRALVAFLAWILGIGCSLDSQVAAPSGRTMQRRDINAVLRTHQDQLMAIPGVAGVYVGLMDDEKTPCLRVMVLKHTRELEQQVPKSIEGYPIVTEETGVIRPLRENQENQ